MLRKMYVGSYFALNVFNGPLTLGYKLEELHPLCRDKPCHIICCLLISLFLLGFKPIHSTNYSDVTFEHYKYITFLTKSNTKQTMLFKLG